MTKSLSPLRYPGGKSKIFKKVKDLIIANNLGDRIYVEPFAGGFGIGLGLLYESVVQKVVLNDFDTHIYNFWHSTINDTEKLLKLVYDTPISIDERERQKRIYSDDCADSLADGFATLFLNRVNYSGVIKGGPIGGLSQEGKYKLDCRFNRDDIIKKIEKIAKYKTKILLYNKDAGRLIRMNLSKMKTPLFLNIDPPYVENGHKLYTSFFKETDHIALVETISKHLRNTCWIVTYDDCDFIRGIYSNYHMTGYEILHNVNEKIRGKEVVITNIPQQSFIW